MGALEGTVEAIVRWNVRVRWARRVEAMVADRLRLRCCGFVRVDRGKGRFSFKEVIHLSINLVVIVSSLNILGIVLSLKGSYDLGDDSMDLC